jgi:hypothetical protein
MADKLAAAKNAEAAAIQNATNAAFDSDNAYFAVKNAQMQVAQSAGQMRQRSRGLG